MINDEKTQRSPRRFNECSPYRGWAGVACLAAVACAFVSTSCRAQRRSLLTHHIREAVVKGQARLVGRLPSNQHLKLAIALPLRNQAALNTLMKDLYDPRSPSYRKYLTVQEFADRFGPTQGDYAALIQFAKANGMTVAETSLNRVLISVDASVADINKTFHVTMGIYQHPTEHRTFYTPDREPSVDLAVPLWHISGLDDFSPPRRNQTGSGPTGPGPGGTFLGSDIRAAYGGAALTGAGQIIGLLEFGPFNMSDVQAYFGTVGQPFRSTIVQTVAISGFDTSCPSAQNCGEEALDIEQALSMAPGVDAVVVYEGANDAAILNRMATDNIARQLSSSWGWAAADCSGDAQYFEQFAAQGQSFFMASGDGGAYTGSPNVMNCPVDNPLVTEVGGTDLTTNGAGGSWASESAWAGSGGGISTNGVPIPSYQQLSGVINTANQGSQTLRNVPDVSAEADYPDSYVCANGSCSGGGIAGSGGTSFATPRWAGFMALANQQASNNGKPPIGFLNPTLYAIGTGPRYNSDFHDITSGGNGMYSAVKGYDLVTGWGSPNGPNLITDLAGASACWPAWIAFRKVNNYTLVGQLYPVGAQVSYSGVNYTAAFKNAEMNPSANSGPVGTSEPWIPSGICNAASAATQVISAAQTQAPTHPLSSMFNRTGIYTDGGVYTDGTASAKPSFSNPGIDGQGNAYSRALLGTSLTWKGIQFTISAAPAYNFVSALGQTITLQSGNFSSLNMLATGVNGNQAATFTVTYKDGTTTPITQSLSDWYTPQTNNPGESTALKMAYRDTSSGGMGPGPFYLYEYSFAINNKKTVVSVTLPNNSNACVLAFTLAP